VELLLYCIVMLLVAIDIAAWLYKGAYGCAHKLCEGRETDGYIRYVMAKIDMLKHHSIKPIMVFDGKAVPLKAETQADRRKGRVAALEEARRLMQQIKSCSTDQRQILHNKAMEHYQRAFSVTPQMTHNMIEALKENRVAYVVAPFEADAQVAALIQTGRAEFAISEDSDLLVYR
jgi:exonuclease-1